jgi:hypothetical protein
MAAPGAEGPPPVPVGAASGGQNIDYFFTFPRRGRPASRLKATAQLLFVGVALGDGVACAPECRWRGGRGGGKIKKIHRDLHIKLNYRRIRDLTPLWWPHASLINVTNYVSGGKLNIKPLFFTACLNMEFCLQCGPIMWHHFLVNLLILNSNLNFQFC